MLKHFDEDYEEVEVNDNEFVPIPDGTYQVYVDEICLKETKESKLPMLAWRFKVMTGQREGSTIFKNSVITDKTLSFIKTDFSICDFKPKKFSDIETKPQILEYLLNFKLEVKLVTKGDNQNVYIQRRLDSVDGGAVTDREDIPF